MYKFTDENVWELHEYTNVDLPVLPDVPDAILLADVMGTVDDFVRAETNANVPHFGGRYTLIPQPHVSLTLGRDFVKNYSRTLGTFYTDARGELLIHVDPNNKEN